MGKPVPISPARSFGDLVAIVQQLNDGVIAEIAPQADSEARFPHEIFAEFRRHRLLSTYIPRSLGGDGLTISEVAQLCEILGRRCASTAMIYAMHQIQVACIVDHAQSSPFFVQYLEELTEQQWLLASATTELGIGGDVRKSNCAVEVEGGRFKLEKQAPVISYGEYCDAILVTCRANAAAAASDQVQVLVRKNDYQLTRLSEWDTLGFRATCSRGYALTATGSEEQILPTPFGEIMSSTMLPVSHLVWGSLWTGLAAGAVTKARECVRKAMRKNPDAPPVTAMRLTEVDEILFSMRSGLHQAAAEYQAIVDSGDYSSCSNFGFSTRINHVKVRCSELVVEIVGKALIIVGIFGYKNDSPVSLCREIRDAYGAALMVNNDRIRGHNAAMQAAVRD